MRRNEVINKLIEKNGYTSYLEIGVDNPNNCFNLIRCQRKVGVDPNRGGTIKDTSDGFFRANKEKFDIGFIDGLHHEEQVEKDILNLLKILNPGGAIVVHDLCPKSEIMQRVPRVVVEWTGNGWKAWAHLRATKKNLKMVVLNTDHGIGIIKKGRQSLYTGKYETYDDYVQNKKELLNLKDEEQIFNVY